MNTTTMPPYGRTRRPALRAIPLVLLAALSLPAVAAPVAMVTDLQGRASQVTGGTTRTLAMLATLEPGTVLRLEAGARLVLAWTDRPLEQSLAGPAEASVSADGLRPIRGARPESRALDAPSADSARRFAGSARDRVSVASVQMRATRPVLRIIGPPDGAVLNDRPALEWTAIAGVTSYRVQLSGADGTVVLDQMVGAPPLLPPQPLARGAEYRWRVEAAPAGGATLTAAASFRVLDAARAEALASLRPPPGASVSQRVLYAARLEGEGLGDDARALWRELAAERPEDETLRAWGRR